MSKKINICPECSREAIATCDNCGIQFCGEHHDSHMCEERKAESWLAGQKLAKLKFNKEAYEKNNMEKERAEIERQIQKERENT